MCSMNTAVRPPAVSPATTATPKSSPIAKYEHGLTPESPFDVWQLAVGGVSNEKKILLVVSVSTWWTWPSAQIPSICVDDLGAAGEAPM